jgi:hypothetical protein
MHIREVSALKGNHSTPRKIFFLFCSFRIITNLKMFAIHVTRRNIRNSCKMHVVFVMCWWWARVVGPPNPPREEDEHVYARNVYQL